MGRTRLTGLKKKIVCLCIPGCVGSLLRRRLSLAVESAGHSVVVAPGLLPGEASPVAGDGLSGTGSVAAAHGLSGSAAYGIFPDQGSNQCPLHWQASSLPLSRQGSP